MPVNIDTEAEEVSDNRQLRKSGDSVVLTLTPEIIQNAGVSVGDKVKIATPFSGGEITITPVDDSEAEGVSDEAQLTN